MIFVCTLCDHEFSAMIIVGYDDDDLASDKIPEVEFCPFCGCSSIEYQGELDEGDQGVIMGFE